MTTKYKVIFGCLQVAHAQDIILFIPIDNLGNHMSSLE